MFISDTCFLAQEAGPDWSSKSGNELYWFAVVVKSHQHDI